MKMTYERDGINTLRNWIKEEKNFMGELVLEEREREYQEKNRKRAKR